MGAVAAARASGRGKLRTLPLESANRKLAAPPFGNPKDPGLVSATRVVTMTTNS
jgi:hypothetical protein